MKKTPTSLSKKPLVTKTHSRLKEKKAYEKNVWIFFSESQNNFCKNFHIKHVQALLSDFYFISEHHIMFYKCPLQMFLYKRPTQILVII